MLSRCGIGRLATLGVLVCVAALPAFAEDVEKKFRVALAIGGFNPQDEIRSQAGNILVLVDEDQAPTDRFNDPRNDSAIFGELGIKSGGTATVSGQYAVTKIFVVEGSIGYGKYDVGDVEVQAQFPAQTIPEELGAIDMSFYHIPVGELERVPIQFTALARFRPRAAFNPYVGAGIGYSYIGFDPDPAFNELSVNLDNSVGAQGRVGSSFFGNTPSLAPPQDSELRNLIGASVDADDSFEWHLVGGAELSFRRNWTLFIDVRLTVASQSMKVAFNGTPDLGITVPNLLEFEDSFGSTAFGPYQLASGGLVDGGSLQPADRADPNVKDPTPGAEQRCVDSPLECEFAVGSQFADGQLDPGFYYVQGGSFDYDGIALKIGVRYTF